MIETIKISKDSSVASVAGSIAKTMRVQDSVDIVVVGAAAINQAIKSVAIARGYLISGEINIAVQPSFTDIRIDDQIKTGIILKVIKV